MIFIKSEQELRTYFEDNIIGFIDTVTFDIPVDIQHLVNVSNSNMEELKSISFYDCTFNEGFNIKDFNPASTIEITLGECSLNSTFNMFNSKNVELDFNSVDFAKFIIKDSELAVDSLLSTFTKNVTIESSKLGLASFTGDHFNSHLVIDTIDVEVLEVECSFDSEFNLWRSKIQLLDLSGSTFQSNIDLSASEYKFLNINSVSFNGDVLLGKKDILSITLDLYKSASKEESLILNENLYTIKEYFLKNREFDLYEYAHIEYSSRSEGKRFSIYKLLNRISLYGTSPSRVTYSFISIYIAFAIIYALLITISPTLFFGCEDPVSIWDSLYFSGITMLTIGYGDISPAHYITKILSVTQGFLGIFLLSYLVVILTKKTLR